MKTKFNLAHLVLVLAFVVPCLTLVPIQPVDAVVVLGAVAAVGVLAFAFRDYSVIPVSDTQPRRRSSSVARTVQVGRSDAMAADWVHHTISA